MVGVQAAQSIFEVSQYVEFLNPFALRISLPITVPDVLTVPHSCPSNTIYFQRDTSSETESDFCKRVVHTTLEQLVDTVEIYYDPIIRNTENDIIYINNEHTEEDSNISNSLMHDREWTSLWFMM